MRFVSLILLPAILATLASPQSIITTVAGTQWIFPADGRPAVEAPLGRVNSVAVDAQGRVYFADSSSNMVLRRNRDGAIEVVAGNGIQAFSGDGGPAVNASLWLPGGVAVDRQGNVYIADSFNNRIRKVTPDGIISTLAGTGRFGTSGDNGPAVAADLGTPVLVAVDNAQNVFFLDRISQRVRRISSTGVITTFAGSSDCSQTAAPGCNATRTPFPDNVAANRFCFVNVQGLAVDASGQLYITDGGPRVVVRVSQGTLVRVAGGGAVGQFGEGLNALNADLAGPAGLSFDAQGTLHIAEAGNTRIRRVRNGTLETVAGSTTAGFRDGTRGASLFRAPLGIAFDDAGTLHVADQENFRIRSVNASGDVSTIAGNGRLYDYSDGNSAQAAVLSNPNGVSVDGSGTVFIGDTDNVIVRRISQGSVFSVAGNGVRSSNVPDGAPAVGIGIGGPGNVAFDAAGNAYFPDFDNHVVRRVARDGTMRTFAGVPGVCGVGAEGVSAASTPLNLPVQVTFDRLGNLFISEYNGHRVRKVTPAGVITTVAGAGVRGFAGDNGPAAQARLAFPLGLAADKDNNVYIADRGNGRVRRVGTDGRISTVAGGGGTNPVTASNLQATLARLTNPSGLTIDGNDNLYVTDSVLNAVFQMSGGVLRLVAGNGTAGFSGDGGIATQASINSALGVAIDSANNLYIADTFNNRIRVVRSVPPTYDLAPMQLTFNAKRDGSITGSQPVLLAAPVTGLRFAAEARVTTSQRWLKSDAESGIMPATLSVTADPTGLAPGNYNGTLAIVSPGAQNASRTIRVEFTVTPEDPPVMDVDTSTLTFSLRTTDQPANASIQVANRGSGSLNYEINATAENGNWLRVSASSSEAMFATPNEPSTVSLTIDPAGLEPDTYVGRVRISSPLTDKVFEVPVVLTVIDALPRILLSQNSLNFTVVQNGGAPLAQNFAALNIGVGTLNYKVEGSTLDGGDWLQVVGNGGQVQPGQAILPQIGVSVDAEGLTPGMYSARVRITDPNAINSPQTLTVYLTVLRPGDNPGPDVSPGGLIFQGEAGSQPGSQGISIANLRPASVSYSAVTDIVSTQSWLLVAPDKGLIEAAKSDRRMKVQADFTSLNPGIYRANVVINFSDSSSRTIQALAVVNDAPGKDAARAANGCTPSLTVAEPTPSKTVYRSNNVPLRVTLTTAPSGCRLDQPAVTVVVEGRTYELVPAGNTWSYTWNVARAAGVEELKFRASYVEGSSFRIGDPVSVKVTVADLPPNPPPNPPPVTKSIQNGATGELRATIAPGALIAILGENLADTTESSDPLNLPLTLAGTSVEVAGNPVPISYASPTQINVMMPFQKLRRDSVQEIRVRRKTMESVSSDLVVAKTQPGILTVDATGKGQGHIYKLLAGGTQILADRNSPAQAGDTIVIRCAGLGDTSPAIDAGTPASATNPSTVVNPAQVLIGNRVAQINRQILSPVLTGQYEVEAVVPAGLAPGDTAVQIITARQTSPSNVTMAIR